jgi:hypothetical protein
MRSRGCPGDGTRRHRMMVLAMDRGSGIGQWQLWTAGWRQHSNGARRRGGSAGWCGNSKEVRRRLRGAMVLEDAGWSSMEVER